MLVENHAGIIPVEFDNISISDLGEVVQTFPYINQCKIVTLGAVSILTPGTFFEQLFR